MNNFEKVVLVLIWTGIIAAALLGLIWIGERLR